MCSEVPESSAVRTNRSLRRLHVLLSVLVVMVLIAVLLSAIIAIKLGHMEQQMDHAQDQLSKNIQEAINVGVL
uniref:TarH domain-containing protein n=1 Tax=Angiostrongylus cantonensis TaxID=6313 RepID=A0A0K0DJE3_ANGCA